MMVDQLRPTIVSVKDHDVPILMHGVAPHAGDDQSVELGGEQLTDAVPKRRNLSRSRQDSSNQNTAAASD